jgi:hypothetical protein
MSRSYLGFLALGFLLLLTALTGLAFEGALSNLALAGLATAKAAVIGWVFLELDRSARGWAALGLVLVVVIAGASAVLIGG